MEGFLQLNGQNGTSNIDLAADNIRLWNSENGQLEPVFSSELDPEGNPIIRLLVKTYAQDIILENLSALTSDFGYMTAGIIEGDNGKTHWNLNTGERWVIA